MATFRNFILRFFISFVPILLVALVLIYFKFFSKLEVALLCTVAAGIPWLFYEIFQRYNYQAKTMKAMLKFCNSMERVFSSMTSLEETTKNAPKKMLSELHMVQNIMEQIIEEKNKKEPVKKKINDPEVKVSSQEFKPPDPQYEYKDKSLADVININQVSTQQPEQIIEEKYSEPMTQERLLKIIENGLYMDRIEMLVQPIVSLPQRKARHFECFVRIKDEDGSIYTPDDFIHLAEEKNLIRLVDNAMLLRCIQMVRSSVKKKFSINFFSNMSQYTLLDKFFFDSLTEFLLENRDIAKHMVFEFPEEAIKKNFKKMQPFLRKLMLYDCYFSVDQVKNLDIDLKTLKKFNFKYIKFCSSALAKELDADGGRKKIKDFKKACDKESIDIIISHVEDEDTLIKLNDFNFDYGQGFLFGTPIVAKR